VCGAGLERELERNLGLKQQARGGLFELALIEVTERELGEHDVVALGDRVRERLAASVERRVVGQQIVGDALQAAVKAGLGVGRRRAVLEQRGRGDQLEGRGRGGPRGREDLERVDLRVHARVPGEREHRVVAQVEHDRRGVGHLAVAEDRQRRVLHDGVERVEQAMPVGEVLHVHRLGRIDVELGGSVGLGRGGRVDRGRLRAGGQQGRQRDRTEVDAIAPSQRRRGVLFDDVRERRGWLAQLVAFLGDRLFLDVERDPTQGRQEEDRAQSAKPAARTSLLGHRVAIPRLSAAVKKPARKNPGPEGAERAAEKPARKGPRGPQKT
jgi:hypothetical protein